METEKIEPKIDYPNLFPELENSYKELKRFHEEISFKPLFPSTIVPVEEFVKIVKELEQKAEEKRLITTNNETVFNLNLLKEMICLIRKYPVDFILYSGLLLLSVSIISIILNISTQKLIISPYLIFVFLFFGFFTTLMSVAEKLTYKNKK